MGRYPSARNWCYRAVSSGLNTYFLYLADRAIDLKRNQWVWNLWLYHILWQYTCISEIWNSSRSKYAYRFSVNCCSDTKLTCIFGICLLYLAMSLNFTTIGQGVYENGLTYMTHQKLIFRGNTFNVLGRHRVSMGKLRYKNRLHCQPFRSYLHTKNIIPS